MNLDIRTVVILTIISCATMSIGTIAAACSFANQIAGMRRWALASGVQTLGWMVAAADSTPSLIQLALANSLLALSIAMCYHALYEFLGLKSRPRWVYQVVALLALALIVLSLTPVPFRYIAALSSTVPGILLGCSGLLLLRPEHQPKLSQKLTAAGFLFAGFISAGRGLLVLFGVISLSGRFVHGIVQDISFATFDFGVVGITFGFLLMCLERYAQEILQMAHTDLLTGCLNRRAIEEIAGKETAQSRRTSRPLSALLIDLDHFKQINDTYGHTAGDAALKAAVLAARLLLSSQHAIGRYGGEEFLVVLPETPESGAMDIAEQLRHAISEVTVHTEDGMITLTASIGVASLESSDASFDRLVRRADQALYAAKHAGRNQVIAATAMPQLAAAP